MIDCDLAPCSFDHLARFRCHCGNTFKMVPGPHVHCPRCKSIVVTWVDYQRFEVERSARLRRDAQGI